MVKAVLFDIGEVLVTQEWGSVCGLIAGKCPHTPMGCKGWPNNFLPGTLQKDPLFLQRMSAYETGRITTEEFIEYARGLLARSLGYTGSYEDTLNAHRAIIGTPIISSIKLLMQMVATGRYKVALVSDNNPVHAEECAKRIPDVLQAIPRQNVILSHEVGYNKTGPEIFKIALCRINVEPQDVLMIDNTQRKLDICRKMGIQTYLYGEKHDLVAGLKRFGICC
jgi:FMN phosphatase YigB (HAD superfamily)